MGLALIIFNFYKKYNFFSSVYDIKIFLNIFDILCIN